MEIAIDIHKTKASKDKFYKNTFEKIPKQRRQKILSTAISEFASNGYNGTNINMIAKKAGISIGSMYSYFDSKESLFLTIVDEAFHLLETALKEVNIKEENIFEIFERLLIISKDYALNYPEMNQIYLDVTTQGLSSLSSKLSYKLESITAKLYYEVIKKAKEEEIINCAVDEKILSFCLDNLIIMFQFSFTSDYYKERMKIFLGSEIVKDEKRIIEGIINFVKNSLTIDIQAQNKNNELEKIRNTYY